MARIPAEPISMLSIAFCWLVAGSGHGDEVQRVMNGPEPRDGVRSVVLREAWRVGGDDGEIFFGRVPRVIVDQEGNIHVLDAQICKVYVFSPEGELMRTVFNEGEGPGEALGPRDMLLMPDGKVGLVLESLGIVKFVDAAGDPAGSLRFGEAGEGNYALVSGTGTDGGVILAGRLSKAGTMPSIRLRRNFLVRSDLTGKETAVFAEFKTVFDFNNFNFVERDELWPFQWSFALGGDGRIFAALDRDKYEITVFAANGEPEMVIQREYSSFVRTNEDHEAMRRLIETSNEGMPIEVGIDLEKTHPAIAILQRGLQVAEDGALWVLSGRGLRPAAPGVMAVFDVFDSEGVFVRQVELVAPHDGTGVGIVLAGDDRVIVVEGFLESIASQFGNGATFSGEGWNTPEIVVYEMDF